MKKLSHYAKATRRLAALAKRIEAGVDTKLGMPMGDDRLRELIEARIKDYEEASGAYEVELLDLRWQLGRCNGESLPRPCPADDLPPMTIIVLTKQCAKCGSTEPAKGFYVNTDSIDGLQDNCIACFNKDKAKALAARLTLKEAKERAREERLVAAQVRAHDIAVTAEQRAGRGEHKRLMRMEKLSRTARAKHREDTEGAYLGYEREMPDADGNMPLKECAKCGVSHPWFDYHIMSRRANNSYILRRPTCSECTANDRQMDT